MQIKLDRSLWKFFLHLKQVCASYQFVHCLYTKLCHILPQFLCNKPHKIDNVFWLSSKSFSQFWILCRHTDWAGIQIAYTHHYTPHCHKRRCRKPKLFCTKDCGNCNISSSHQLAICLDSHFAPKPILNQCLVCFCKSKFPWKPCIVDRAFWRRSSTAIIA